MLQAYEYFCLHERVERKLDLDAYCLLTWEVSGGVGLLDFPDGADRIWRHQAKVWGLRV